MEQIRQASQQDIDLDILRIIFKQCGKYTNAADTLAWGINRAFHVYIEPGELLGKDPKTVLGYINELRVNALQA